MPYSGAEGNTCREANHQPELAFLSFKSYLALWPRLSSTRKGSWLAMGMLFPNSKVKSITSRLFLSDETVSSFTDTHLGRRENNSFEPPTKARNSGLIYD